MKYQFRNDYSELGNKDILSYCLENACKQNTAYGLDEYSKKAENKINELFGLENAECHFLAGGTQTNMVFISYCLRPYEGVLTVNSGHINVHETAAVEGSGHKIYTVNGINGKITSEEIENCMIKHIDEHMVKIKMVYISNTTEIGTVYTKDELLSIKKACDKYKLYLYMDGARLGSALTSEACDYDKTFLGKIVDAFYIGGTKNGLPLGEALVIVNDELKDSFRYQIKNKGAMLAKGYFIGMLFNEAFKDNLYFKMAENSNKMAYLIRDNLKKMGYELLDSPSNQQFLIIEKEKALKLMNEFGLELWEDRGNKYVVRIVTSFNTKEEDVKELLNYFKNI